MFRCYVCGSEKCKTYREFERRDDLDVKASGASRLSTNLCLCLDCNHVQQHPIIDPDIVAKLYAQTDDAQFVAFNGDRIQSFVKASEILVNKGFISSNDLGLDIGCGGGAFPMAALKLGIEVHGIEPSQYLSDFAQKEYGVTVHTGFFEEVVEHLDSKYDFICFWDVIEHIYDLNQTMRCCEKVLKNNGKVIINIPVHNSFIARLLGNFWPMYLDVHVQYFSATSLDKLMNKFGFERKHKRRYFQSLPIGYVVYRAIFHLFGAAPSFLKEWKYFTFPISYYIGQQCFVYEKASDM